ncbi:MAG: hypothetical protein O9972_47960, partial [Burkholderiales bacterium]|nr:hypothetical protein [Burkholderiales bacterium]
KEKDRLVRLALELGTLAIDRYDHQEEIPPLVRQFLADGLRSLNSSMPTLAARAFLDAIEPPTDLSEQWDVDRSDMTASEIRRAFHQLQRSALLHR